MRNSIEIKNTLLKFEHLDKFRSMGLPLLLLTVFLLSACGRGGENQSLTLPGARQIINAGLYNSVQDAINALPQEGGMVILPPGEFPITEPLYINKGDVCLKGSGTASHIINNNTDNLPAMIISSDPSESESKSEALWRIQISDLQITGNDESGHGILAKYINEIYLEGITVSENGGDGIRLDHCTEDPRIVHSVITYNKETGLNLIGCHDIVVNGNQFEENNDALHCFDGYNLTMSGNNVDDHLNDGVVLENTYGSVISGNMIEECNGEAVILDRDCYGINIGSNVIAHNTGGVELNDAHGIAVSANTFTVNRSDAIYLSSECGRITVTGNNFSSCFIGEGQHKIDPEAHPAAGITLAGGTDIVISGNIFSEINAGKAILLEKPSNNVLLGNNIIVDSESDHIKLKNSLVKDNLIVK